MRGSPLRYLIKSLIIGILLSTVGQTLRADQPPLIVEEQDLSPSGVPARLRVTNGTLTKTGSIYTLQTGGGGGGATLPLPPGATNYVNVGNVLQVGSSFYVQLGLINGSLGIGTSSPGRQIEIRNTATGTPMMRFMQSGVPWTGVTDIEWYNGPTGFESLSASLGLQNTNNYPITISNDAGTVIAKINTRNSSPTDFTYGVNVNNTGFYGFKPTTVLGDRTLAFGEGYFFRANPNGANRTITLPNLSNLGGGVDSASLIFCKTDSSTNTVTFAAASGDTMGENVTLSNQGECVIFGSSAPVSSSAGTWYVAHMGIPYPPAGSVGRALITNNGKWAIGLSSAASNAGASSLLRGDSTGGITSADGFQFDSFPGFVGAVTAFANFFALSRGGVGFGGPLSQFDTDITNSVNMYPPSVVPYDIYFITPNSTGTISQAWSTGGGNPYTFSWQNYDQPIYITTNTTTIVNTTAELSMVSTANVVSGQYFTTKTLPANYLSKGRTLNMKAKGLMDSAGAAGTITFNLRVGGVIVATTGGFATPSATLTDERWDCDIMCTTRATGASGSLMCQGNFLIYDTSTFNYFKIVPVTNTAAVTVNTTQANAVDFTAQWAAADPAESIECTNYELTASLP